MVHLTSKNDSVDRVAIVVLHIGILVVMLFGYQYYIVPLYGYAGFTFKPIPHNYFLAAFLLFVMSLTTPIDRKPSSFFLHIILIFAIIPMLALFAAAGKPLSYTLQIIAAYIVINSVIKYTRPMALPLFQLDEIVLVRILLALGILYVIAVFALGGGRYFNLNISQVYEFRSSAASNLPSIFGYFSPFISKVALPFSLAVALVLRKHIYIFLSIVLSIIVFGLTAHKSTIFYAIMVLLLYWILGQKSPAKLFASMVVVILLISIADFALWHMSGNTGNLYGWFGALSMRRAFFVPANLNYFYYDFFAVNEWVLWSNSKLTAGLIHYPYDYPSARLIGYEYFDNQNLAANTGFLGSGYMHAGFSGVAIYSVLIGFTLRFIDGVAVLTGDARLATMAIFGPVFAVILSADLPLTLLTHGLLANLLLISLLKHGGQENNHRLEDKQLIAEQRDYQHWPS